MHDRTARLREQMLAGGLDAVLVTSPPNIRYLSGFSSEDGTLLITRENAYLLTDFRYTIQAKDQTAGLFEVIELLPRETVTKLQEKLQAEACKRLGFEDAHMSVARRQGLDALGVEFISYSNELAKLRIVKSATEIQKLQEAQNIADAAFLELLQVIRPGMSEKRVVAELLYICGRMGSDGPSFDPIVGAGPNGAMPHAVPTERELAKGDLVVLDFGCIYAGYCSDMTRTISMGQPSDFQKEIYGIVLEAQIKAFSSLRPGITGKELDAVARGHIAAAGYEKNFGHGLGHGFGLQIHEAPTASINGTDHLLAGMSVTVEPGIYIEGQFGVRIEDCCVLTETGHRNLVTATKELIIL
ncbi:MAG: Xaa-Pro peptidase family protein [Clostridiales bacterium]|nr:Xaa-Pro peptidase family protein [Clostridiales bacterium]